MDRLRPLKRSIIKEELVALTGDFRLAVVLDQFIALRLRVKQNDEYLRQEFARAQKYWRYGDPELVEPKYRDGSIRTTLDEVVEESMLGSSRSRMMRDVCHLVEQGWLERRHSPSVKMDKTYEYRVQVGRIAEDFHRLGYALDGYTVLVTSTNKDGDQ